ncbi:hypothetical protein GCM10007895_23500 [Paraferrimonas sedimenticola]|uniref:Uncharacterized protein n=2 Tax=Paraferrimonas sedimenticola TaxID=375674 RepID=A0AA37VZ72_9GAMM|nr:hypothetical protein GCM10007895_23500 [Paraferrimonas sedimenticola]
MLANGADLCVVRNPEVRQGFLDQYEAVLRSKNISYRIVSEQAVPQSCQWTSTYEAHWRWDLALYMAYAEIKVFQNGSLEGVAKYDATRGSGNFSKFIDAEPKIRELVNQLINI